MIILLTLFQNDLNIFEFFEYHLECRIEIAIIWDISELSIQFIGVINAKKEVFVSQDFRDGTLSKSYSLRQNYSLIRGP